MADMDPALETTLSSAYNPAAVEQPLYRKWEAAGLFKGRVDEQRQPYCIVMPPPNVTGKLHVGHALDTTVQDILARWRRMSGDSVLWQPGTDHAGIATQAVVERRLREEGTDRHALGREAFVDRIWSWKDEYEARIVGQLKRLGSSADWSRLRFTMDEGLSRAVTEVFVRYWERGLIYRGEYLVNWCPDCRTAISDLEVNHEDQEGTLWTIRYPLVGGGEVRIATTRPETILGDTAVAVNPNDPRHADLVGREALLPLADRRIPIVADEAVDTDFGTGAVKVTPGHDPTDFEIGQRHELPTIRIIGEDGRLTPEAGAFAGLDRGEARDRILAALKEAGALVGEERITHAVGHCDRCGAVVEPLVSRQWFLRMKPLAGPAIDAVRSGDIRVVPERFTKVYLHWMENLRDWCISRQLWWGHRIPAYTCGTCGHLEVARSRPGRCPECGASSEQWEQVEDVLDTWFSSALWPFSTLGWPDNTPELRYFYPTAALSTGYDILFFWVARMIFSGLAVMDEVPFRTVVLHGLVRDGEGRKMSKSSGNGIDPIEAIEEFGADALRFALVWGNAPGNDLRLGRERLEAGRNFANKIWNAARLALLNLEGFAPSEEERLWFAGGLEAKTAPAGCAPAETADLWLQHRLNAVVAECARALERCDFGEMSGSLHEFLWSELCDWYLEAAKPRLYGHEDDAARRTAQLVLSSVLEQALRLLHPVMPFVTEAIWTRLPGSGETLLTAPYPVAAVAWEHDAAADDMAWAMDLVRAVRNLRAEAGAEPGREVNVVLVADPETAAAGSAVDEHLDRARAYLHLARVGSADVSGQAPTEPAVAAVVRGVQVLLPLRGLVDVERERERLAKERAAAEGHLQRIRGRLQQESYLAKAPAEVVQRDRDRAAELERSLQALDTRAAQLEELDG